MFSPESTLHSIHGGSIRNPRRRPRNDSDGAARQAPSRKRSKLSEEPLQAQTNGKLNGNGPLGLNGHTVHSQTLNIPVREKRISSAAKRASKSDGSITLTNTANYTVKKLPSLPEHFRQNPEAAHRAFTLHDSPYALALTHTNAYVWDYTSNQTSIPRVLPLNYSLNKNDPLPVGALIRSGPSSELGVVVVSPKTGKITFWENIDSAESLSVFQQRKPGVDGSLGTMLSGETVTSIEDAGVAGFVLTLSTGRLAQLTVRDAQGRPHIQVHFIRANGQSGGLFSGLKNVFAGSSWRKEITAVKSQKSRNKGQAQVIASTRAGLFQVWELGWEGQHNFKGQVDTYAALVAVLPETSPELRGSPIEINILDFAVVQRPVTDLDVVRFGHDQVGAASPIFISVLAVVGIIGPWGRSYALVDLDLAEPTSPVRKIRHIEGYADDQTTELPTARLLRPNANWAFIVFNRAIAIVSLYEREAGPGAQLGESSEDTVSFQDVLRIRQDRKVAFTGHGIEENRKDGQVRCVLFTTGAGVLRISSDDSNDPRNTAPQAITAKSKIEQAVFFGPASIFDFTPRADLRFAVEELENAVLQISQEIITSQSKFIPAILPSMEQHLSMRAAALEALAKHIKEKYPPISRRVKWLLLHNAERVAAARGVWGHYEMRNQDTSYQRRPLFDEVLLALNEKFKSEPDSSVGETDRVRQWFARDIGMMEKLLPWVFHAIRMIYQDHKDRLILMAELISEGDDIVIAALESAFKFRDDNVTEYGLEDEPLKDSILENGYEDLPSPWTSVFNFVNSLRGLVDVAARVAMEGYEDAKGNKAAEAVMRKLAVDNPKLVLITCQTHVERYRWCIAQNDMKTRTHGEQMREEFETKVRSHQLKQLNDIGQVDAAMQIAERFRDLGTLVGLAADEARFLVKEFREAEMKAATEPSKLRMLEILDKLALLRTQIKRYFKMFKQDWAEEWFSYHIQKNRAATLFSNDYASPKLLTDFLHADPSRARLAWINDVVNEKDFLSATSNLLDASDRETNVWSKKIEASLSKLSLMAARSQDETIDEAKVEELEKHAEWSIQVVRSQDRLYDFLRHDIQSALDRETAVDLCMEKFGKHFVNAGERPALRTLLHQGLEQIVLHRSLQPDLLIDVLTLMNDDEHDPAQVISRNQFTLALQVLDAGWARMEVVARDSLYRLIWKRCYLRDDWAMINDTAQKSDADVSAELEQTTLYWALKDNAVKTGKWEQSSNVLPLGPSLTLSAQCTPSELRARFPNEDLREPIIRDNLADDGIVKDLISRHRLEHWFDATKDLVLRNIADEEEAEEQEAQRMMRAARQMTDRVGSVEPDEEGEDEDGSERSGGSGGFEGDDERGLVDGEGEGTDEMDME